MKKALLTLSVFSILAFVSCKENASSKVNSDNVAEAAQRDEAGKQVPVMSFEKEEHDFGTIEQGTPQETIFKFTYPVSAIYNFRASIVFLNFSITLILSA